MSLSSWFVGLRVYGKPIPWTDSHGLVKVTAMLMLIILKN